MRYEQMVTIYGTIAVEAKNKREAEQKIGKVLFQLKDESPIDWDTHGDFAEILIGDIEREDETKGVD